MALTTPLPVETQALRGPQEIYQHAIPIAEGKPNFVTKGDPLVQALYVVDLHHVEQASPTDLDGLRKPPILETAISAIVRGKAGRQKGRTFRTIVPT